MPRPLTKKQKLAPGQERSLSVTLKSLRNPPLDITLPSLPLSTSILSLKDSISKQTSIPTSKLRLLWNKKPVQDSKTLKDVVGEEYEGVKVELGVMVIGGAAGVVKRVEEVEVEPKVVGMGVGGEVLKTDEFWGDLRAFLVQRLKDEGEGERVLGVFRKVVEGEK
jgi:hypothetical protein